MQNYFVVIFVDACVESYFACYCVVDFCVKCYFLCHYFARYFDGNYYVFLCVLDTFADFYFLLSHVD